MFGGGGLDLLVEFDEFGVDCVEVYRGFFDGGADIPGDVEVVAVLFYLFHGDSAGVALYLFSVLVSVNNLLYMFFGEYVLAFSFFILLACVDEQNVILLFAFFED